MFRSFVDESEIEEWFEEEKTKLNKTFYDASYNKKNVEQAKKIFDEKFSRLLQQYNKEFEKLMRHTKRSERIRKPWLALRLWWLQLMKRTRQSWKVQKEIRAKKKFDKEYARLMKR